MRNSKFVKYLIAIIAMLVLGIVMLLIYFLNVKISDNLNITVINGSITEISAISPTGGEIEFYVDGNNYEICNRYVKDIKIKIEDCESFKAILCIGNTSVEVDKHSLIRIDQGMYLVNPELFPKTSFWRKVQAASQNQSVKLFFYKVYSIRNILLLVLACVFMFLIGKLLWKIIKNNGQTIVSHFKSLKNEVPQFLKIYKFKIVLLLLVSTIPPLIYLLTDWQVLQYWDITVFYFILIFSLIIFPLLFLAYFSSKFKLNRFYWWSFLISFLVMVFILKPLFYLYGFEFRDDISKFFVKAYNNNLLDCITTPDSGYIGLFQNLSSYLLLKVLGFKNYFPEALQIYTALSFSALFASFNLKTFRCFVNNDSFRFLISVLFALSPFVFDSAFFLYEVPFVASAFLFILLFSFFSKSKISNVKLYLTILILVIFALSKPVFVIFSPFILALILISLFGPKNHEKSWIFFVVLLAISIQIIVVAISTSVFNVQDYSGFGTQYDSSFSYSDKNFLEILPVSIFLFVRKFCDILGLTVFNNSTVNIFVNIFVFVLGVGIAVFYLIKIVKRKDLFKSFFIISAMAVSFATVLLYVRSVTPEKLIPGYLNFADMSILQMLRSPIRMVSHRYLMLSGFADFIILIIFISDILDRYIVSIKLRQIVSYSFLIIISALPLHRYFSDLSKLKNPVEKVSYWRTYSNLIFNYPDSYYIPYNGFPIQKHCVKFGIDKIVDTEIINDNILIVSSINPSSNGWDISEIILENKKEDLYPQISGITLSGQNVTAILVNGNEQATKALVYRFDKFYNLEKILFYYQDSTQKYSGLLRIVGKYE